MCRLDRYDMMIVMCRLAVICRLLSVMSGHTDITEYNYFDVEDFSVDSFFRSLELQSRFTPSDLEFSFPADLENVPISSCLSSVGFLDSTAAKSSNAAGELSVAEDGGGCRSGLTEGATETSTVEDNDDDNATAVDVFFRSLQLRSCLLRTDDEAVTNTSPDKTDSGNTIDGLFSPSSSTEEKNDRTPSNNKTDVNVCHGSIQSGLYLPGKSRTGSDCLSSSWNLSSDGETYRAVKQSSSPHIQLSETAVSFISSTHTAIQVPHSSFSSADCRKVCEAASAPDHTEPYEDRLYRQEQRGTAKPKDDVVTNSRRPALKGGKISCDICSIELSSKYSYVRHLLTPLHCRRATGYCVTGPPSTASSTANTEDIVQLISRHKPIQCRICRFYGDTSSQLLYHLTSTSHYSRVKRKLVRCIPCQFVGASDDLVAHIKSDSHATLVNQSRRPCIITAYRSRGHQQQVVYHRAKVNTSCIDCGVKFPSASSLKIHIRRKHSLERPFKCSVCSKSYCDNSTLMLHYRTAQHHAKCAQVLQ